jgi:hypothetical protein
MSAKKCTIKVTVLFEQAWWVGIFERNDPAGYAVARKVFGGEPTDPELYEFVLNHYDELKFSESHDFKLIIKRKNPKRVLREVKNEMKKVKAGLPKTTIAQDVLRLELEKNKKIKKTMSKNEKEAKLEKIFQIEQSKRKKKHQGH